MEFLNKKQKIIVGVLISIMFIFIGYYILNKTENSNFIDLEEEMIDDQEDVIEIEKEDDEIVVHVTGEVENEGIVKVKKDSRLIDVIEEAGGTTDEADLSKVNLAYTVEKKQKIYIPNTQEPIEEYVTDDAGEGVIPEEAKTNKGKVNINTAKQTELETLNGIGPSTALKIIDFRNENGEFKKIEDIKDVPGIGESKYESIKDDICV